jgi:hypothetical protein
VTDNVRVASAFVVTAITIASEVLFGLLVEQRKYVGVALDASTEETVFWTLLVLGIVAVVSLLGPTRLSTWFLALVFAVLILLGSFVAGQAALSHYLYKRDFTFRSVETVLAAVIRSREKEGLRGLRVLRV